MLISQTMEHGLILQVFWDGVNFMIFNSFRAVSEAGKQALLVNHRFIGCSKYYNI